MKISQTRWTSQSGWDEPLNGVEAPQLVLLFGGTQAMHERAWLDDVRSAYPGAHLLGCSTAGEIRGEEVTDETVVATAVRLERSSVRALHVSIEANGDSRQAGVELGRALEKKDLAHVFVLSDGLGVNGSELVQGLASELPPHVTLTGGLSGDGDRFQETLVLSGDEMGSNLVAAIGLYGEHLEIGYASLGGWDPFGPERVVTRSQGNVLYELDGKSALELYKTYLGEHADGLPATGLLFPLTIRSGPDDTPIVRTILAVDEEQQSLTFAGDVPQGAYARLMRANFDRLVEGAAGAARTSQSGLGSPDLAVLISCVGRKMVLRQRVEEEVEAVRDVLGPAAVLTGFYSYGEISPFTPNAKCELHNQTMTITAISER